MKEGINIFADEVTVGFRKPGGGKEKGCGNGTKKELFSEFIDGFYEKLCQGSNYLTVKKTNEDVMRNVMKVINMGYESFFLLPLKLNQSFLQFVLFEKYDQQEILDDFYSVITKDDKNTLMKGEEIINNSVGLELEKLHNCLKKYDTKVNLENMEDYKDMITGVAENFLIHNNKEWIFIMRNELTFVRENLTSLELSLMYSEKAPTVENIINSLNSKNKESSIFKHLRRFLWENPQLSERFLTEVTSSALLSGNGIAVEYYDDYELLGKIMIGTCGDQINFPKQFEGISYGLFEVALKSFISDKNRKNFNTD